YPIRFYINGQRLFAEYLHGRIAYFVPGVRGSIGNEISIDTGGTLVSGLDYGLHDISNIDHRNFRIFSVSDNSVNSIAYHFKERENLIFSRSVNGGRPYYSNG